MRQSSVCWKRKAWKELRGENIVNARRRNWKGSVNRRVADVGDRHHSHTSSSTPARHQPTGGRQHRHKGNECVWSGAQTYIPSEHEAYCSTRPQFGIAVTWWTERHDDPPTFHVVAHVPLAFKLAATHCPGRYPDDQGRYPDDNGNYPDEDGNVS